MVATLDDMLYCINLSLYNFIEQTKGSSMETSEIIVTARAIDLMLFDIVVDGVNVVEQWCRRLLSHSRVSSVAIHNAWIAVRVEQCQSTN